MPIFCIYTHAEKPRGATAQRVPGLASRVAAFICVLVSLLHARNSLRPSPHGQSNKHDAANREHKEVMSGLPGTALSLHAQSSQATALT